MHVNDEFGATVQGSTSDPNQRGLSANAQFKLFTYHDIPASRVYTILLYTNISAFDRYGARVTKRLIAIRPTDIRPSQNIVIDGCKCRFSRFETIHR